MLVVRHLSQLSDTDLPGVPSGRETRAVLPVDIPDSPPLARIAPLLRGSVAFMWLIAAVVSVGSLDPFGPVAKNLPVLALLVALRAIEERR